ncbi:MULTISPECIES: isoprenylcysteine carboxylmethyltransferase family protein [Bosea]|uniref:methyltransferase family protein n=1 Tax=Bosea TaxID=85413 RepID=UPI002150435D|nr:MULTISPECIES: isoprenylcysteine carboxylmethyltransferase family protein [Bosea]MCR4524084.1 isoprenylcysteine carboxylmethyltransferase family protein [Bosea sp. 47.2.35]MDR6827460.1 protein-S-isoprenylcysteine O-methyltransferase Ste14 [Bosea robiniae]MDR6894170.1 protein-S-isoprenylcysteine O-methyltransferase Ste14 [Bosea sp. BE109]MDR7137565.1 protein-S-isoprenylcysteine O-methyltransferase Ste14 [Bosea sp. BE168]MDR7174265.1 protein-S-isoprenylcysteine O-methyltransferase Ste14 [Bosea
MSNTEIAAYLVTLVYVGAFLFLSLKQVRASGQSVWIFTRGSRSQRLPALLFKLGFAGSVLWPPVRAWLGGETPFGRFSGVPGLALAVVGATLALWAQMHMGRSWRIGAAEGESGAIVASGPFAFSRNPAFVGQTLLFIGLFLVRPELVELAFALAVLVAIALQVRIEEGVLRRDLGARYLAYQRRVNRWIGRTC